MAIVGEKGPELLNLPRGSQVIPNIPKIAAAGGSGSIVVNFSPVIDNRGASVEAVARLEQVLAKQQRDFSANVVATVRAAKARRVL
jgi:pyruvate/2-oxoglutarate dehydrogenase complex dihydrolipoamide dehydrogenase (E3) component